MSEALDRDLVAARCTGQIGSRIVVFRETESTNDIVLRAAIGGEPEGFVAFAESQTNGRGQFGRKWSSASGLGLWFSVLLRPKWESSMLAQITPLIAVATARGIAKSTGLPIRIKPPNDILVGSRKLAGILSEARTGQSVFVAVGIGINVNHTQIDFPFELQMSATSVAIETGIPFQPRESLAGAVLQAIEESYDANCPPDAHLLAEYTTLSRGQVCDRFLP